MRTEIKEGDCLEVLPMVERNIARLIYVDPPFNTGKKQKRRRIKVERSEEGTRRGFKGASYAAKEVEAAGSYADRFDDYVGWLMPRLAAALDCATDDASLIVHLDYREVHYVKVALDQLLGRDHFMNEIIWAYDFGARSKKRWPTKHDSLLWYVRDPKNYVFDIEAADRIPYMAPGLVGAEKAARGKTPTDVWWHTIVPTNGKEKTGYPTQKPLGLIERIIKVHTEEGDTVLDAFAGSGTTGAAAVKHGRGYLLIDENPEAIAVMRKRLG